MTEQQEKINNKLKYYFVDEAGDSTLFSRGGKIIIGKEGCSNFFILGLLDIGDPKSLHSELENLRKELLSDPYFKNVPSTKIENKKTALAFHAKDDLPEIRREVYHLLKKREDLRFYAVIADKRSTLNYVRRREFYDSKYHYQPNENYDYLVRRLFKGRLHKMDEYKIVFAKRGNKERTAVLKEQLTVTQKRFMSENRIDRISKLDIQSGEPQNYTGLQAVDYFLWALQRLYEKQEERFLINIWEHCRLIIDIHDTHNHPYGEYYSKSIPLTLEKIKKRC